MTRTPEMPDSDRLVLYGYGLFETILVWERPRFLRQHWARMADGARLLSLPMLSFAEWSLAIENFLDQDNAGRGAAPFVLRVTLTGGEPAQGLKPRLLFHTRPLPYTEPQHAGGIELIPLSAPRNQHSLLTKIKSANYLENILGKKEALARGADEGLWCNCDGCIAEGTMSNVFWVSAGRLFTPSVSCGCLPGTRRALVLAYAVRLGIEVVEGCFPLATLADADEVFVTNALMGIMPVRQVGDWHYRVPGRNQVESSLTRLLEAAYGEDLRQGDS